MKSMNCKRLTDRLDDYVDGRMDQAATEALAAHIEHCGDCRDRLAREHGLRDALKDYGESSMSQPDTAFFDSALARAAHTGTRRQRNRWVMTGVGGTIAAGLVLWMLGGTVLNTPDSPAAAIPSIAMTLEEPRRLNLVFSSATAMVDATMTVVLPRGIEVAGFAGQREISWLTSLTAGKNVLPLTLIATSPQGGELLATLRYQDDDKTFRVQVEII
jgi:anti-sigma factor RsiW